MTDVRLRPIALEYEFGAFFVWLIWALRPGQPQIVAICTDEEKADLRIANPGRQPEGTVMHKERVPLDHAFGYGDIQSLIYRAANRESRP